MLPTVLRSRAPLRALHTARVLRNQNWAHLTNILASEIPPPVQVKSITTAGVLLQDGRLLPSACIFLEGEVLLWDVPPILWKGWDKIPKPGASSWLGKPIGLKRGLNAPWSRCPPEILLIGTGKSVNPLPAVDVMDSGRRVAAALLPLQHRQWRATHSDSPEHGGLFL
ncbi:hypothetical protein BC826DRAFT_980479 [Russula brevipes]|nr:hypothetical protein BC826DRAFT_980479 [Russula brevipes]